MYIYIHVHVGMYLYNDVQDTDMSVHVHGTDMSVPMYKVQTCLYKVQTCLYMVQTCLNSFAKSGPGGQDSR